MSRSGQYFYYKTASHFEERGIFFSLPLHMVENLQMYQTGPKGYDVVDAVSPRGPFAVYTLSGETTPRSCVTLFTFLIPPPMIHCIVDEVYPLDQFL